MGIETALHSALSGLQVSQESIAYVSQNIANVNNPDYARRVVEQASVSINGIGQGVALKDVVRDVDAFLIGTIRAQQSRESMATVIDNYYAQIQNLLGDPTGSSTINNSLDAFFSSLKVLSASPETPSLRIEAVNKGVELASNISRLARSLQELRYEADQAIQDSVGQINVLIGGIATVNDALSKASLNDSASNVDLEEQRDNFLRQLAQHLDINVHLNASGEAIVVADSGKSLVDDQYKFTLEYIAAPSIDSFINNVPLNSIIAYTLNSAGGRSEPIQFMSGGLGELAGVESSITSNILSGSIAAYKEIRDHAIPLILDQLDNLAQNVRDQVNIVHNSGSGYPALTSMVGTRPVTSVDTRDYSGKVRIGILDDSSKPVQRPDGSFMKPLELDLGLLDVGSGAGQNIDLQTIINEVNEYYFNAPVQSRTVVGKLYDVRMVAASNFSAMPGGQISFDMEYNNDSQDNVLVQVTAVNVSGGATGLVGGVPPAYTSTAGARARSGDPFTVSFAGGGGGPYTVDVQLKTTDANGLISTSTVSFVVDDNPPSAGVINSRYVASSVVNANIIPPVTTKRYARASIVDSTGNAVAAGGQGYLQIAADQEGYHISIDDLSSMELGLPRNGGFNGYAATNKGFSSFFELNDFFVRNNKTASDGSGNAVTQGSALSMQVREDIKQNQNLLSLGSLSKSPDKVESQIVGATVANGQFIFNGNPSVGDTISMNGSVFTFVAAASTNSEISIGATLPQTLTNAVAKLSGMNSVTTGKADQASYTTNNIDTIYVQYNVPGTVGDAYQMSGNFAVISAQVNSGAASSSPVGALRGGSDKFMPVTTTSWAYEIGAGASNVISKLANLAYAVTNFASAGNLPANSNTLSGYSSAIISYCTAQSIFAANNAEKESNLFEGYNTKLQSGSGVNLDQELADTIKYQNAYTSSAKMIGIIDRLFNTLLDIF